jgi:3-deoxy-D-manno-octulosonic-acid transferase
MSPALAAYRMATAVLEPLATLVLRQRAKRGKEDSGRLNERLGRPSVPRPPGRLVWFHGASVGESLSLLPLVEALARDRPEVILLVTSGTVTAAALLARRLPPGAIHQYVPVDAPGAARRFLTYWRPTAAVFVESELWPNLLLEAKARGCRLALLGARVSQKSAAGWSRVPAAARAMFGAFDLIMAQDAASCVRFETLGAKVAGEVDLKQAAAPLPCDEADLNTLQSAIGERPVLLAASTHPGEEEMIAQAYRALAAPSALLIVAPRHPARGEAIAGRLRDMGLTVARRSAAEPLTSATQVYLADTLGELGLFFRLARAVVMGGSLIGGVGGHNPLEPARLALPVITGVDIANFREVYAGLIDAGGAVTAADQPALNAAVAELMGDPRNARRMGLLAKAHAVHGGETLAAALAALTPLLAGETT